MVNAHIPSSSMDVYRIYYKPSIYIYSVDAIYSNYIG